MTQPKLTATQQRAFDWLGEDPDHCATESDIWHVLGGSPNTDFRPNTGRALIRKGVLHEMDYYGRRYYIHPKFAGGSDDDN